MTEGISALGKTQIGVEALAGSSTDLPTTIWVGTGVVKDNLKLTFPKQKVGIFGGTTRSYISETGGEVQLADEATFEALPYIFQAGISQQTPTTDTSSARIWNWAMQNSDSDAHSTTDLATLVIETGDNIQAEIFHYGFVREFTISGSAGSALTVDAVVQTRAPAATTFTASLAVPTVETILFSTGALYIDPSTDAVGTTVKSNTLLDMSLKVKTGWMAKKAKDNRTDFSFIKRVDDEIMLDLTFEHNSIAVAEKAAWRNQTERALRLTFLGSALSSTDAGAAFDTKAFVIDLYGKWDNFGAAGLEESDGNNVYKGTFRARYSTAAANKAVFKIYNELASLP
jgi:hypothetical protein